MSCLVRFFCQSLGGDPWCLLMPAFYILYAHQPEDRSATNAHRPVSNIIPINSFHIMDRHLIGQKLIATSSTVDLSSLELFVLSPSIMVHSLDLNAVVSAISTYHAVQSSS